MINFPDLVAELSELIEQPLAPDLNGALLIIINELIPIQMEMDVTGEYLILTALVSELPPGRFRENILKDALKANSLIDVNRSLLAYLASENQLVLQQQLQSHGLTAQILYNHLMPLLDRATNWRKAIDGGRTSPSDELPQAAHNSHLKPSLFGFK